MSGLLVAILGLTLVILYLICFYRGLGLLTAAAMVVFAIFYLGLLATLSAFGLFSLSFGRHCGYRADYWYGGKTRHSCSGAFP